MNERNLMQQFLNRLRVSEGEERQKLVQANLHLLRTDLAQKVARQRVVLYAQHTRRLETALKLVRAEQERLNPSTDEDDVDEAGGRDADAEEEDAS